MKTCKRLFTALIAAAVCLSLMTFAAAANPIIEADKLCSITVHKYIMDRHISEAIETAVGREVDGKQISPNAKPLAGIVFRATRIDDNGAKIEGTETTSAPTDENGITKFSDLKQGKWYVEESENTAKVASKALPVTITLPFTSDDGGSFVYDAHIYPKNADISVNKDIQRLGNDHHTADIDEDHTWIITASLPDDLSEYNAYSISDDIDERLDFKELTKVVAVLGSQTETQIGTETILRVDEDYIVKAPTAADNKLKISLTESCRQKIDPDDGSVSATKIRVYFVTDISSEITAFDLGIAIPNTATVNFTNSFSESGERISDTAEVHTGGLAVYKYEDGNADKPLSGAEFKIATSKENADNGVYVQRGGEDYTLTSDENGQLVFIGLSYGAKAADNSSDNGQNADSGSTKYWIVETKSPTDENGTSYQMLGAPIEATIDSSSHLYDNAVRISNVSPSYVYTGGIGTPPFVVFGLTLAAASVVGIICCRRKIN